MKKEDVLEELSEETFQEPESFISEKDISDQENLLEQKVDKESKVKEFLVDYVGSVFQPENDEVTVSMIIDTMAEEFPEFVLALAQENWIRGYHQGLVDVEEGLRIKHGISIEELVEEK
tara:strand:+ start:310 stop:666 length:357 start_codon:yes stop_codon:yes gene_type:complete